MSSTDDRSMRTSLSHRAINLGAGREPEPTAITQMPVSDV